MVLLYRIFSTIFYPFIFLYLFYRVLLKKEHSKRYREKLFPSNFNIVKKNNSKLIWFHASSIGEFRSILPIINHLNDYKKKIKFLITTTTLSSGNLAEIELKKFSNVQHRFFPFDINFLMTKFLQMWKPDYIFLVDSEIWPNLIFKAKELNIPISIINARLTSKTFNKWNMFPKTSKRIFNIFDLCLCSNMETKDYLEKLSANNVILNGNIKLINQIDKKKIENINENILLKRRFWFAASTHRGEEEICFKTHIKLKERYKDIITIIAPRHIERKIEIKALAEKFKLSTQIITKNEKILEHKEVIILNSFGELKNYFKYAKSVFIGKSMVKKLENNSGQDPIEAAKLGCKVYHGPYVYNFKEIYQFLKKNGIATEIHNHSELYNNLTLDLVQIHKNDNKISNSIKNLGQKTLVETMTSINKLLFNENK